MIEIVDGALQVAEGRLVVLAVAGDVLHRPGEERLAALLERRQRPHGDAIPEGARGLGLRAAEPADDADVLDGAAPVLGCTREAIDGLAGIGMAGKEPRHAHGDAIGHGTGKVAVVLVHIGDLAVAVGDNGAERQAVHHRAGERPPLLCAGEAEEPGGEAEHEEHAGDGQHAHEGHHQFGGDAVGIEREGDGQPDQHQGQEDDAPQPAPAPPGGLDGFGIAVLAERRRCHCLKLRPWAIPNRDTLFGLANGGSRGECEGAFQHAPPAFRPGPARPGHRAQADGRQPPRDFLRRMT